MKAGPELGPSRPWKLTRLIDGLPGLVVQGSSTVLITSLAYDSRRVQPGSLYFALPGGVTDGRLYIDEALRRGAVAVVHEGQVHGLRGMTAVRTDNARIAMGELAARFHGYPSRALRVIGITGTNGKTTTAFMVRNILRETGTPTGMIGTIFYEFGGRQISAVRTTPESLDLQQMLAKSRLAGDQAVVMEVSSQGLAAERLRGTTFATGVFTNLSVDHLDFHHTMEQYFSTKKRLFEAQDTSSTAAPAVVNLDDPYGRRLAGDPLVAGRMLSYGFDETAAVRAVQVHCTEREATFHVLTPWGEAKVTLPLTGRFNVSNALAAIAVCGGLGVALDEIVRVLGQMAPVPGRLERVEDPRNTRHVYVDYAHTEDALRNVLQTLRETTSGRLLCVFGCGGNRDHSKRPRMGAAVAELADHIYVTSDNPRGEDPLAILNDIVAGIPASMPYTVEPDRTTAIRLALEQTQDGDTLLVAGKGHETYQEIGGRMVHFDDREVLRTALQADSAASE